MLEEDKEAKREYGKNRYKNMPKDKKTSRKSIKDNIKQQKNRILFFLYNIKMSEKALKFGGVDVMYLDPNKLYDWVMSQYLPYSKFKWLHQKELKYLM